MLIFAHRILPWRYRNLDRHQRPGERPAVRRGRRPRGNTLFRVPHVLGRTDSILRISKDISRDSRMPLSLSTRSRRDFHPYTPAAGDARVAAYCALRQQPADHRRHAQPGGARQRAARRQRIFLDRDEATGTGAPDARPYRDIFQKSAVRNSPGDQLSILCEDAVAEGVIRGILDVLNVELGSAPWRRRHREKHRAGRISGSHPYAGEVRQAHRLHPGAGRRFPDDGRDRLRAVAEQHGHAVQLLFLPGDGPPEQWLWDRVRKRPDDYAARLGLTATDMQKSMNDLDAAVQWKAVQRRDVAKDHHRRPCGPARPYRPGCRPDRRAKRGGEGTRFRSCWWD